MLAARPACAAPARCWWTARCRKSCTLLAAQADGRSVTTIEGVAQGGDLHPVQEQLWHHHGVQCGYCSSGMVLAAVALLEREPTPTDEQIRAGLKGNLCRCTGYANIVAGGP